MKRVGVSLIMILAVSLISFKKASKYKFEIMETSLVSEVHSLTFLKLVGDSRCPKGVDCEWEGDAHIDFLLVSNQKDSTVFDLHTNDQFNVDTLIDGMRITLVDVSPYPKNGQARNQKDYEITVVVEDMRE